MADSGSTKTEWHLLTPDRAIKIETEGYNPYYKTAEQIAQSLRQNLLPQLEGLTVEKLCFYGAGTAAKANQAILKTVFSTVFESAQIELGTDLLAAARATALHQKGICCILGTGANSCYYDGQNIVDNILPLGYILGDEGAGTALGKLLLQAYFYREMPRDLQFKMEAFAQMDRHFILDKLLHGEMPNRFLASFSCFAVENRTAIFIQKLVQHNFEQFIERQLSKYAQTKYLPIHFVGSIAYGFQDILCTLLEQKALKVGKILKTPFPELLDY